MHLFFRSGLLTALLSFSALAALAQNSTATPPSNQASAQASNQASKSPAIGTQTVSPGNSSKPVRQITTPSGLQPIPGLYDKPCNCQAQRLPGQTAPSKKKHKILKGLGKELGIGMSDLSKDLFLAFSVQGNDPYEMPENPNIPYVAAEARLIDGSVASLYKYPDHSWRIKGGFLDGTYACEQSDGLFIVQYTNGARGTMKRTGNGCEVIRPDNTVTTVSKSGSSAYRVSNSKLGYMGDINPDSTGLNYEFAKQNF